MSLRPKTMLLQHIIAFITLGVLVLGGVLPPCSADSITFPEIDRHPAPADFHRGFLEAVPKYDPANASGFQVDLRGYNLSRLDLREAGASLAHALFDDKTIWPAADRLAEDFDRARIVELGKNPGLGVRSLHAQGITGRGVGIAIIDNPLLTEHQEYAERLRLYEEINVQPDTEAHMHGPAVASIAVGKTVGVAPEADLYYIGRWAMDLGPQAHEEGPLNVRYDAEAIRRILQIDARLPAGRKIRVISISNGWQPGQTGYAEVTQAVREAGTRGMFVIYSTMEQVNGFKFHGLGRDLRADPNEFASYRRPQWGREVYAGHDRLLVPMEARATASPTGKDEYAFYAHGGWSWCIPYLAGMYALAAQVDPQITPERFWALAMKTGRTTGLLGPILDPAHLIEALRRGDLSDPAAVTAELAKYAGSAAGDREGRVSEDFAARIARLDLDHAGRKDVIEQLGHPVSYRMGKEVLDPDHLPSRYAMLYPAGVHAVISADRVLALVFMLPGYRWRNQIEVGTPIQDVFQVLGLPAKTIENARSAEFKQTPPENGVLYKDIDGVAGTCYLPLPSQGVELYFTDNHVRQMTLLPKGR